eukprot:gene12201-14279_t
MTSITPPFGTPGTPNSQKFLNTFEGSIDLNDALDDSPQFRKQLKDTEMNIEELGGNIKKILKSAKQSCEMGIEYNTSFKTFADDLLSYRLDARVNDELLEKGMIKFTNALKEICNYREVLHFEMEALIHTPLQEFAETDVKAVKEQYKKYDKYSQLHDSAASKLGQIKKKNSTRIEEVGQEVNDSLRTRIQHGLDLVEKMNEVQARRRFEFLELFFVYLHAQSTFFHQGYELFRDLEPHMRIFSNYLQSTRKHYEESKKKQTLQKKDIINKSYSPSSPLQSHLSGSPVNGGIQFMTGRTSNNLVKKGYLFKKSDYSYSRRFFSCDEGKLSYFRNGNETTPSHEFDLFLTTVRIREDLDRRNCFEVLSPDRSLILQAESHDSMMEWVQVIQNSTANLINNISPISSNDDDENDPPITILRRLHPSNTVCADCDAKDPDWASINFGSIVCIDCSGIHRSLGVHITKVRSLVLDKWEPELLNVRSRWLRDKYDKRLFVSFIEKPLEELNSMLYLASGQPDTGRLLELIAVGADSNHYDPANLYRSPLHNAVANHQPANLCLLLQNGAQSGIQDIDGNTPLHVAADCGSSVCCILLIMKGVNLLNMTNKDNKTALDLAIDKGQVGCVSILRLAQLHRDDKLTFDDNFAEVLRDGLGIPVDQIKFVLCMLASYPLAMILKRVPNANAKHVMSIVLGIAYCSWSLGHLSWLHSFISSAIVYAIVLFVPDRHAHIAVFVFNYMGWTMDFTSPQMILTLKLTSFAYNVHDGRKSKSIIKKDPNIIGILWIQVFRDEKLKGKMPSTGLAATKVFAKAMLSLAIHMASGHFPITYLTSAAFAMEPLYMRIIRAHAHVAMSRFKYYFGWYMSEGSAVLSGMSFNGYDKNGNIKWDRITNVYPLQVEWAENIREVSSNWNIGTADWLKTYVYMRLTPVGVKPTFMATLSTYAVSAFWHGFYPGYYIFFIFSTFLTEVAKDIRRKIRPYFVRGPEETPIQPFKMIYDFVGHLVVAWWLNILGASFLLLNLENTIILWRFVKVVKNKAYFKRFQVQYRRRREGKTDYQQRTRLITQDKNKYNSPKYRLVARFSNKNITAQIIYSKIVGDFVLCSAYSNELTRYGITVGLTNYAAAYATGLLLARRLLTQLKLNDIYKGQEKVNGEDFLVKAVDEKPRPFKAFLDVGLARTTTGQKVFAVMKGATDGGLYVPHKKTRFVGYNAESKKLNADVLRKYIFGNHVAEHMKILQGENEEVYKKQFSLFIKNNIGPKDLEAMYTKAHAAIRKDPSAAKKSETKFVPNPKFAKMAKRTYRQRSQRIMLIKQSIRAKVPRN